MVSPRVKGPVKGRRPCISSVLIHASSQLRSPVIHHHSSPSFSHRFRLTSWTNQSTANIRKPLPSAAVYRDWQCCRKGQLDLAGSGLDYAALLRAGSLRPVFSYMTVGSDAARPILSSRPIPGGPSGFAFQRLINPPSLSLLGTRSGVCRLICIHLTFPGSSQVT